MENRVKNKRVVILGVFIVLSFLLRFFTAGKEVVYPDSTLYLSFAKSIINGKFSFNFNSGTETILPPLYSMANAFFLYLIGDVELSGVLVSAIAGALLIIPVFYLAKMTYNEKTAWISSILVFLSPILIHWSGAMLTESLFITLFISGIAMGWYAIENKNRILFLLSGALIGLSYMTRVIGLLALPVLGLWIVFFSIKREGSDNPIPRRIYKDLFSHLTTCFLGFILITGIYLNHLHSFYGHWTLAGSYGSIKNVVSFEGASTTSGWENLYGQKAEESFYIKLIRKTTVNLKNYSSSLISMLIFATVFVIMGLFLKWKILYVVSFIVIYFGALLVQPLSPMLDERIRYLSPVLPLFLIIASGGIARVQSWIKRQIVRQAAIPVMVGIVLLSFTLQLKMLPIHFSKIWDNDNPIDIREKVGLWMKENLPQQIRVMSRKPYIPYYADAVWFNTPATYDEVIKLASSNAVDYIILDRGIEYYLRPELRFLFDPKQVPQSLEYVGGIRHPKTGELYIGIYRIRRVITNNLNK